MELITVATIFLASLNMSDHDCGYTYNVEMSDGIVTSQFVYKSSDDGRFLSQHLKYNYTYDEQQRLVKKEILKWDSFYKQWERKHCLNYVYDMFGYSVEYASWNAKEADYTDIVAKQIYDESMNNVVAITSYEWNKTAKNWIKKDNTLIMCPSEGLLSSLELKLVND